MSDSYDIMERELTVLVEELLRIKRIEERAKSDRIDIEEAIATLIPTKEAGQKTETLSDGVKVTVKRALSYKADVSRIINLFGRNSNPAPIKSSTTYSLYIPGYEWYRKNDPLIFDKLSKLVEVKPKKVSVVIQEPKE